MYYKLKSNILFRRYKTFGYLTDNRNYGYKKSTFNEQNIGDKIVSESGALFIFLISKEPRLLDDIAANIHNNFEEVDLITLKSDIRDFYTLLEDDGFVVSGNTLIECADNDKVSVSQYTTNNNQTDNNAARKTTTTLSNNTQLFFEEYYNGVPQLSSIHIEITSKCNERCVHCYIPHDCKVSYMETDLFYNVLQQCCDMNLLHINLSGGEPMLHKNFVDFLKKCRELNFSINILSNLTLLTNEILDEVKLNPLISIQTSLYSMTPDIHDAITQSPGSFEKTMDSINKLISNNIPMQISCPVMKQNKNSFEEVIKWAKKQNIYAGEDFGIIASYNNNTYNLNCRLTIDEIHGLLKKKVKYDTNYIDKLKADALIKQNATDEDFVCSVCSSSICIADNGNVYPCAGWQGFVVGNVKETTLIDIWLKSKKIQYLRNIKKKDFPICKNCINKNYCTMCMVRNANENRQGDPLIVNNFFCELARLDREIVEKTC